MWDEKKGIKNDSEIWDRNNQMDTVATYQGGKDATHLAIES